MLTYIKETHRTRGVVYEAVVCDKCLSAEIPESLQVSKPRDEQGYSVEVKPWTGRGDQECTYCPTRHDGGTGVGLAPEFRGAR